MSVGLDRITVTGTYTHFDGTPAKGSIIFEVPLGVRILTDVVTDEKLVPQNQEAILDANGHIAIALPATDDPDVYPTRWTYHVTELILDRPPHDYFIEVSYTSVNGTMDLADVVPVDVSSGVPVTYVPIQEFNALKAALAALQELVALGGGGGVGVAGPTERVLTFNINPGVAGPVIGQTPAYIFGDGWTTLAVAVAHATPVDIGVAPITVDVNKNGTSIFAPGDRPSLATGETVVVSSTFADDTADDGDIFTVDLDEGQVDTRCTVFVLQQRLLGV